MAVAAYACPSLMSLPSGYDYEVRSRAPILPILSKDSETDLSTQARAFRLDKNTKSSYKVRSRRDGVVETGKAIESLTRTGKLVIRELLVQILSTHLDSISRS